MIHRDIKLENVLINKFEEGHFNVKLADFGLSVIAHQDKNQKLFVQCGSPCYIAPEILKSHGYRENSDIFSLGSVFYNIISGHYLFYGKTLQEQLIRNRDCNLSHVYGLLPPGTTQQCKDLLFKMLEADPNKRPSAKDALSHAFFRSDREVIEDMLTLNRQVTSNQILNNELLMAI